MATMRAAICKELGKPVVIEEIPIPTPEGRDLLVRVQAVSLCHSDVSIVDGIILNLSLPLTIGHEAISVVESLGPNAASFGFKVGDRIGAPLWHGMCLECISCREQAPEFCPQGKMKGVTTGGYFAEYALVDPASAVHVPDTDLALPGSLAPIFCAGITVWDALRKAKLEPNDTVAIVGVGGLGALAAQYASGMGAKVIALDIHDEQLQNLKSSGHADEIINTALAGPENTPIKFSEVNKGRMADVVLVTTGAVPAYKTALSIVRAEGRLVAVGLPKEEWSINLFTLTMRSINLIGSKVSGQKASKDCLDFSLRKGILPKVHPRKFVLEDINEMMDLMRAGKVHDGRMVVQFF